MKTFLSLTLFSLILAHTSRSAIFYDIAFDQPTGELITAAGPHSVPHIQFGDPKVASSFAGLTDKPLVFDISEFSGTHGLNYDQIWLTFPKDTYAHTLSLSFDLTTSGLLGSEETFNVILDGPAANNIEFRRGNIYINSFGYGLRDVIGSFTDFTPVKIDMNVDIDSNIWSVSKNGELLTQVPFFKDPPTDPTQPYPNISTIRFSFGMDNNVRTIDSSAVAIDNILASGTTITIPEPTISALLLSGILVLLYRLTRRCS